MSQATTTARRFAALLDHDDYDAARRLMVDDCTYAIRDQTMTCANDIIASYRTVGEWVRATFEDVAYGSTITTEPDGRALITFTDYMRHGQEELHHTCQQRLTVNEEGLITHIEHIDLPGEREKAQAFNKRCGVKMP